MFSFYPTRVLVCCFLDLRSNVANTNWLDQCSAQHYVYNGGTNGSSVELFKVAGGGHTWPGSGLVLTGGTCMDFNAAVEIWRFFRQYTLSDLINNTSEITEPDDNLFSIFPNPNDGNFTLKVDNVPALITIINSTGQIIQQTKNNGIKYCMN